MNKLIGAALTVLPLLATAHSGHGLSASPHWHASDTAGLLLVAALAAAAWLISRRK